MLQVVRLQQSRPVGQLQPGLPGVGRIWGQRGRWLAHGRIGVSGMVFLGNRYHPGSFDRERSGDSMAP